MNNAASVDDNHASPLGDNVVTGGGGVYLDQQTATLVMNDTSAISGNQVGGGAVSLGGGVAGNDSHATLNDSASISGNQALVSSVRDKSNGGGFYFVNGGSLELNDSSSITGNSAADDGGGIYRIDHGLGTITGATAANVSANTPNNCGGPDGVTGCSG